MDLAELLPALRRYMARGLDEIAKPENDLKVWFGAESVEDSTLSDFDWYDSHFPEWLQHKHVVELYNFLAQEDVVEEEDEEGNDEERLLPAA